MPRVPAHLCKCALGMLQGGMRTADVARAAINCNVHTVRRPRVTTPAQDRYIRTSHLQDRYRMATTTARVTPGTHNPSISAQTVHNRLREAGLRACRPVVRQVLTRHHRQQRRPMGTNPPSLDQTGPAKSALHWRVAVLSHQG